MGNRVLHLWLLAAGAFAAQCATAGATQLTYKPVSPTFGGDPNNPEWIEFYNYAQNRVPKSQGGGDFPEITLPDFEELFKDLDNIPTIIIPIL